MNRIPITKPFINENEIEAVQQVLMNGWLVQGEKVREFEQAIAKHEGVQYCCATTSCTTALQLAMLAEGMSSGMDVLVPSFTFVATANAVVSTGAVPILADVDERTYNLDVDWLERHIRENYDMKSGRTVNKQNGNFLWGIVPVHQFGLCADMYRICDIAERYHLKIIEDAACALGSTIEQTHIGGFGNAACISFHPRKSITTGEGGMILTNDEAIYWRAVELRNHGSMVASDTRHKANGGLLPEYVSAGFNYRMTDIQGAIGCKQFEKLDYILKRRREIAAYYAKKLGQSDTGIIPPHVPEGYGHTYQSYVCMLDWKGDVKEGKEKRDDMMKKLDMKGIATRQGTHAVHKLKYYKDHFSYKDDDLPIADRCDSLSISLPVYVDLTQAEQDYVIESLIRLTKE